MKTLIFLALVTLAEASIGIFVKLTGDAVPVYTLVFYRLVFAALLLAAFMPFFEPKFYKFPKRNIRDMLLIGFLIALQLTLFTLAMTLAPVANVVIFWSVAPFFTFIFSYFFLGEKARKQYILIFLIALAGIFIAQPLSGGEYLLGNMIALVDGAIYAGMVTYLRSEGKTESHNDIFWFMLTGAVYMSPTLLLFGPGALFASSAHTLFGLQVPTVLWVACLGILSTGVAFLFISVVLKNINANVYSLVDIIVSPVIAAVLAFLIFGDVPSLRLVAGGVLLLASGAWLTYYMSKPQPHQPTPVGQNDARVTTLSR